MKRFKHNLSHYRMLTADMGELVPISCIPVLPGDTIQHSTSAVIRVTPLNTPVMHPTTVRVHHWFCPNRIVYPGWEEFITGGPDGASTESIPTIGNPNNKKSVPAYLGVPPAAGSIQINAMAIRAFNKIYNQRYRDQDLVTERDQDDTTVPRIAWEKDRFTAARPWTQRGPKVTLPMGGTADVRTAADVGSSPGVYVDPKSAHHLLDSDTPLVNTSLTTSTAETNKMYVDGGDFTQVDVNEFRAGFALQRYMEARSRYGARFTEYLRYLGVTPSDARVQDPEYLGGGSTRLNFSEVLQTTPSSNPGVENGVGDLYGHGIAGVRSNAYRKFFEEHGYVISTLSVRPKAIYQNGCPREFRKTTKEDFWQRELQNLGQQEVLTEELDFAAGTSVFGFQDQYDEYRHIQSQVSQDFRDTLNSWHLARDLSSPTLNNSFITCNPSSRIYQVSTNDPLWIMVNHKVVARRLVSKNARPAII